VKAKGKKADAAPVAQQFHVTLSNTVLFPEGGGQPCDFGTLTTSDGVVARVVDVQRVGNDIIHTVSAALPEGAAVQVHVDWERRQDVMQQHSGQHLISAVFKRCFNVPTVSWSMAPKPEYSYIELDPANMTSLNAAALPPVPAHVQPDVDRAVALWTSAENGTCTNKADMQTATEVVMLLVNALVRAGTEVRVHVWDSVEDAQRDAEYIEVSRRNILKHDLSAISFFSFFLLVIAFFTA
jgi:misacylated tRNA(Ala) deacylase